MIDPTVVAAGVTGAFVVAASSVTAVMSRIDAREARSSALEAAAHAAELIQAIGPANGHGPVNASLDLLHEHWAGFEELIVPLVESQYDLISKVGSVEEKVDKVDERVAHLENK